MIKKIGILTGGESSEREIALKTANAVDIACQELGYGTVQLLFEGDVKSLVRNLSDIDFVFIALHGGKGENGVMQGLLDSFNIRYNGSGVLASALGMDKSLAKQLAKSYGIQTPEWQIFTDIEEINNFIPNKFPIVVKPSADGSTVGLSFVKNQEELVEAVRLADKYDGNILIEKYISGRELTVTIIGQNVYPIIEIIPKHKFYDYECKYKKGMSEYICPAELPNKLTGEIQHIALKVFN
ncbi:MAG: D-alanine--D-alanine ligase, partial [Candidatus Neomarinimicrobiota bacterium]